MPSSHAAQAGPTDTPTLAKQARRVLERALARASALGRLAHDCGDHLAARLLTLSADEQLAAARGLSALEHGGRPHLCPVPATTAPSSPPPRSLP